MSLTGALCCGMRLSAFHSNHMDRLACRCHDSLHRCLVGPLGQDSLTGLLMACKIMKVRCSKSDVRLFMWDMIPVKHDLTSDCSSLLPRSPILLLGQQCYCQEADSNTMAKVTCCTSTQETARSSAGDH